MPRKRPFYILSILALTILALPVCSQKRSKTKLNDDVPLPADYALDYQLGIAERGQVRGSDTLLENTEYNQAGLEVFSKFLGDPTVASLGLPYQWNFTIVNNNAVNAYSLPDGEVSVGSGLAKLIGTNPGLWAAVLSHETAHVARRHAVRKYLYDVYIAAQLSYYQARVRAGDSNANWSIVGLRIAAPIARAKLSRNLEHDADVQGMMLMARDGYHPDFVFALDHLLRATTGDQSHFAAFFSSHPRWDTREQRDDRAYADALAEYNQRWPDSATSPGGVPPLVAFAGKPTAQENKQSKTADLTLPIYCRNATEPLQLAILFRKDHRAVQALDVEHRNDKGELISTQQFECSEKTEATPIVVHLPATLVSKDNRKLQAQVIVYSMEGQFVEEFRTIEVHFPKP